MSKDKIILNSINPLELYGEGNDKINLIKSYFADLKITPRGLELILEGNQSNIDIFKKYFSLLLNYLKLNNELSKGVIKDILSNSFDQNNINVDFQLFGKHGLLIKPRTMSQRKMISLSQENNLLFAIGPAGTGKTYTAIALACKALKEKYIKKIILTRPAIEAGENLGFLPGDLYDKLSPYMTPLYDALNDIFEKEKLNYYFKNNLIEIVPLAFMRGRTLDNAFVILDEAQNTTIEQMKMFLTRMGPSAKFIICGDVSQVDLPKSQKSGLVHASNILKSINGINFVKFTESDIVRHKLVKSIIKAYKK
ncbi:MAG: phosphate starvation-inducible protein PhoH [Flavobacteriales bacterium]|nr:phosphate starvation-inducible protein PhoH [Flavobacteriales bacterium]|tara:strand:- start:9853 stop:10779 length:927 start_codon:yes stop_codon:yes gene_type:complete